MVIEEVARLLSAEGKDLANVVNSKGRHLGTLAMADIIAAIVPPAAPAEERTETSETRAAVG